MPNLEWRDRLRQELQKRRLPSAYSARLLEELTDHFTDVQKENLSMDALTSVEAKLGTPESLATAAENEYLKRTFAGRHPILTFALLPIPILSLTLFAIMLFCCTCKSSITPLGPVRLDPPTAIEWSVVYGSVYTIRFLPFFLTAWLFMTLSRRANRPAWGMAACGLVALIAILFQIHVQPPTSEHNLMVSFNAEFGLYQWQNRLMQSALPLALGLWKWRQMTKTSESLNAALPGGAW